jgi:hypothetical protein
MIRSTCLVTAGCLVLAPLFAAEEPAPAPKAIPAAVEKLVRQLGSEDFKARAAAQKALEQLDVDAVPLLQEHAKQATDPEVRRRLEEVLPALERTAALRPTRVTVAWKEKPVREAVKELAQLVGYKIEVWPNNNAGPAGGQERLVTLDLKDVTFWEALERLCDAGGLNQQWYGPDAAAINLQSGANNPGIFCFEGPFRIVAMSFNYSKNLNLGGGSAEGVDGPFRKSENLYMTLGVSSEPKLPLLNAGQPTITEALDDQNQSMVPPPHGADRHMYYGYGGYRQPVYQVNAALLPSAAGRKLQILKGTIPVTVVSAQKPKITVEKLTEVKNKAFKEGATNLTIQDATKNGDQLTVRLTINEAVKQGQQNFLLMDSQALAQRLEVYDAKGNKYRTQYPNNWNSNGNGHVEATFTFNLNAPNANARRGGLGFRIGAIFGGGRAAAADNGPYKFVYYEWTTMTHTVPFEFRDLPLP